MRPQCGAPEPRLRDWIDRSKARLEPRTHSMSRIKVGEFRKFTNLSQGKPPAVSGSLRVCVILSAGKNLLSLGARETANDSPLTRANACGFTNLKNETLRCAQGDKREADDLQFWTATIFDGREKSRREKKENPFWPGQTSQTRMPRIKIRRTRMALQYLLP
jgi:hypothetical protein